jgi:antitoxin component HigA of HigAB toxin-antitoxin module
MDSNGLRQSDLIDGFGAESTVSEVLNGKRGRAKSPIEELNPALPGVCPGVFRPPLKATFPGFSPAFRFARD